MSRSLSRVRIWLVVWPSVLVQCFSVTAIIINFVRILVVRSNLRSLLPRLTEIRPSVCLLHVVLLDSRCTIFVRCNWLAFADAAHFSLTWLSLFHLLGLIRYDLWQSFDFRWWLLPSLCLWLLAISFVIIWALYGILRRLAIDVLLDPSFEESRNFLFFRFPTFMRRMNHNVRVRYSIYIFS